MPEFNPLYTSDAVAGSGVIKASRNLTGSRLARGTITYSVNFNADDTVTVGGVVFTAKASGATGNQFNIDSTLSPSLDALVTVLNASVVAAVAAATYSKSGTTILLVVHDNADPAIGNAFTIAGSVGTASGATLAGGLATDTIGATDGETLNIVTPAGEAVAYTLPLGEEGQERTLFFKTKGAGANAVVTGTFAGGTTYTYDTAGEFTKLKFLGGSWRTLVNSGGTLA